MTKSEKQSGVEYSAEYFKDQGITYIQFQFTTILGELKEVEFPAKNWESMKGGTGVDGSSLGFLQTEQSDMRAVPDLNSFSKLPWDSRVARFICDMKKNDGTSHPSCPRSIFKKVLAQANSMGYSYKVRPELEWYFLDAELHSADAGSYMATLPEDNNEGLRREITDDMLDMFGAGSPHTIHHEVGPGQHEIELTRLEGLAQADNVQTGKVICKIEAAFEGLIATFIPKPFPDEAGSGLHIHQYLEDKAGENVFSAEGGISEILRWYIGGTLKHAAAISAILNPTTNSYKRLVPHHEAPVYKAWGVGNRTALMRVPGYESKAHMEYRAGDGGMNIYLGMAALLAAGLDGITHKIEPNTPTTKNIDKLSDEERAELGITQLPQSLEESLDAFEQSLFIKDVFGPELVTVYLSKKRAEISDHKDAVQIDDEHEWELKQYLDC